MTTIVSRDELVAELLERDGNICGMPFCEHQLDFTIVDGPWSVTIDHWVPKWHMREQGKSEDEIWALSNLRLAHKTCNAKKGERIPNDDGTLPERPVKMRFRYKREKRAQRPEICTSCNAGRNLGPDEICASCNSGPMPERWPRWAKVPSSECDHELFWCWACGSGLVERAPAVDVAVLQSESGEWDAK